MPQVVSLFSFVCVQAHFNVIACVNVSSPVLMYVRLCTFVRVCACVYCVLTNRPEDHCGCLDPVCEEAFGCDDPDRLLSQRLCPDWTSALHGEPAE